MIKTTLRDIKLKSGATIPKGTACDITCEANGLRVVYSGETVKLGYRNAKANFGAPFTAAPSLRSMEKWSDDGIAKTTTGKKTEPDGHGPDGSPSWLLVLGMI